MKLDNIIELWAEDSKIKREILDEESLRIPKLHHKYHTILTHEKLSLRKLEMDLKVLRLEKFEFYTQGPTKETDAKGWKLPDIGKIIKTDVEKYIEADKDIIELSLRIGLQHEKVALLDSILKTIMTRNFVIKNAIDFVKFSNGLI